METSPLLAVVILLLPLGATELRQRTGISLGTISESSQRMPFLKCCPSIYNGAGLVRCCSRCSYGGHAIGGSGFRPNHRLAASENGARAA